MGATVIKRVKEGVADKIVPISVPPTGSIPVPTDGPCGFPVSEEGVTEWATPSAVVPFVMGGAASRSLGVAFDTCVSVGVT